MKKIPLLLTSIAWVAGLTMLGMSLFDITNNLTINSSSDLAFVTQSADDLFSCDNVTQIPKLECQALVDFYNSTKGDNWKNKKDWLVTDKPCSWLWLACKPVSNPSLWYTHNITKISLDKNLVNWVLPESLWNLTELTYLGLTQNQVQWEFPKSIVQLKKIESIQLGTNKMTGPIAILSNLTTLNSLDLDVNSFVWGVPVEFGNLKNLVWLDLSNNNLWWTIPASIWLLTKLTFLGLWSNGFQWTIPNSFGNLTELTFLVLADNNLNWSINILTSSKKMQNLSLSQNKFVGEISEEFGKIESLYRFAVDTNQLCGRIPETFASQLKFLEIAAHNNNLIKDWYSQIMTDRLKKYLLLWWWTQHPERCSITTLPTGECNYTYTQNADFGLTHMYYRTSTSAWLLNLPWHQWIFPGGYFLWNESPILESHLKVIHPNSSVVSYGDDTPVTITLTGVACGDMRVETTPTHNLSAPAVIHPMEKK